jgi:hypothetical protein
MGKSRGSGNAAWRASAAMHRALPGNTNKRQCNYIKRNGMKCKAFAVRN